MLGALKRRLADRLATRYIVGHTLADAVAACRRAQARGWSTTICPWNANGDPHDEVAANYVAAIEAIRKEKLDCYLSVKAPAIGFDERLFMDVVDAAHGSDVRIHFDSLEPEATDRTFDLIEKGMRHHPHFGCTLPARWRRSLRDAERAQDLQIPVRVVHGQWPCPIGERAPADATRDLTERLAGRVPHVAVASHNAPLAQAALERLLARQTEVSLEQLYGFPRRLMHYAESKSVPTRIYLGYGKAMLPYGFAMVRERPVIAWWILRDLFRGDPVSAA
ncbi:MAG: proline dehydrogenase [Planctomycetota bacterium]